MTEPGAGDRHGSSTWDGRPWPSSLSTGSGGTLSESSLAHPDGEQPPNPWSREGSSAVDGLGTPASAASASPEPDPYRPSATADPYAAPAAPAGPFPVYGPGQPGPPAPGFDPQPTPPYGGGATGSTYAGPVYGDPPPPHGEAAPVYGPPPPAYGSNPYDVAPYAPAYGTTAPYGVAAPQHPQATTAMIFGILGIVFGMSCGLGGLLGIPGIVLGRKARSEIDAEPGRYGGRSQAQAGIVTGVIGVVIAVVVTVIIVLAIVAAVAGGDL